MEDNKLKFKMFEQVAMDDIVKAGGACIGSPETCVKVLDYLTDAGVDEALLFMQMYTTPHDKIMRSIELLAKEVKPRLKQRSGQSAGGAAI
jgi:alkanesulfonate monooxygenase SsuD/methylene tetrahydromethanopterin reductase-like flavin-dependent oxidoreductase (luciferase family)